MRNVLTRSLIVCCLASDAANAQQLENGDSKFDSYQLKKPDVRPHDWPQLGGTSLRNATPVGRNIPTNWDLETGQNIKWSVKLGSQTYGSPVIANGRIFISTNNGAGLVKRYPKSVDIGCVLCLEEETGRFLWQYSAAKLKTGRQHDWPKTGIVSTPYVDGERLWVVSNRGEVVCLDTLGFHDGQNDGAFSQESVTALDEADVVWKFDMMSQLGISQHNMCTCSCTCAGDILFVVTGNGTDESHINIPAPDAPDFIALNRHTGELLWKFAAPGIGSFHGSWSSPSFAVLGGQPQVLFPAGDGWLYSFDPKGDGNGGAKLLWEFDCNLKSNRWIFGGRGTRNSFITLPVIYEGRVYVATGQDCEHGEGPGMLWCIDPARYTNGSDVSLESIIGRSGHVTPEMEHQASFPASSIVPNPKSAVIWHFAGRDFNNDGKLEFDECLNRTLSSPTVSNGLVFLCDFSGMIHCLDAETGVRHWRYNQFAMTWLSLPLIVDGKVYCCDGDGDVTIFKASKTRTLIAEISLDQMIYSSPAAAGGVLYIATTNRLFAIQQAK
jgi:outer membrane protein assembly factor BamB